MIQQLVEYLVTGKTNQSNINDNAINAFQIKHNIKFPKEYLQIVTSNKPFPVKKFDCAHRKACVFERFLSFDETRKGANVHFGKSVVNRPNIIPFGMDPFGNFICFNYEKQTPSIVFYDHEKDTIEHIAGSFSSFLHKLY
jgi:hypothetical protein